MAFDLSKCDFSRCKGECLVRCSYVSYGEDDAKSAIRSLIQGTRHPIQKECITCAACNDFCPRGANPWDLIAQRQEETGVLGIPPDAKPSSDWLTKQARVLRRGRTGGPLISAGGIYEVVPQVEFLTGQVFEDATIIGGGPYACGFTETHLGRASRPVTFLPQFIANLAKAAKEFGVDEIIFTHDACYNVATTLAMQQGIEVPFRPIHILEYIRNWLRDHRDRVVRPLSISIAVQGGCTTRYAPRGGDREIWSDWLAEIFELIGVTSVEEKRVYTGEGRLCCGCGIFHTQHERAVEIQQRNVQDAVDAGAEKFVFICPACITVMRATCRKMELEPIYITQLVKLALGEGLGPAGTAAFGYPVK
ncbi:MAG: heterodisulfide reductase-related iron-sulfur binding cluster [Methanoculleus sp.]|nr:heterodisulfide reductase-related iron-sulfur binding cluster [Methanoculleus sp.]